MGDNYILRYLPLFYEDLEEKITYISEDLANPGAALDLLDAVEAAILKRLPNAESFEQYHSQIDHQYPYYQVFGSLGIPKKSVSDAFGSPHIFWQPRDFQKEFLRCFC